MSSEKKDARIFTLNARGNCFFEVTQKYYNLSSVDFRNFLRINFDEFLHALKVSEVNYSDLRNALTPTVDRWDAGFLFDSTLVDSSVYGRKILYNILGLLNKKTTQSLMVGDLISRRLSQDHIQKFILESLITDREIKFPHSTGIFCVYLNNMTINDLQRINDGLKNYDPYLGYVPCRFESRIKTFLSSTLINTFVKKDNVLILAHEDDRPNEENINISIFPFEEFGYSIKSIQNAYFTNYLSYKIERSIFEGFESDTEFSLNAISDEIIPFSECNLLIDDSKFTYIRTHKTGKLETAGVIGLNKKQFIQLLKAKLRHNYIYDLKYLSEHDTSTFNIIIEVDKENSKYPTKLNVVMEYKPQKKILRLITIY